MENFIETITVAPEQEKLRLDRLLSQAFQDYSRAFLQKAIREGQVLVEEKPCKPNYRVRAGEKIRIELPVLVEEKLQAEQIPLDILYEDEHMLAVNKPHGMVVHPSRGNASGTLANALLHHCRMSLSDLNGPLRPGIVHRLDRDTSGVILCAKTNPAHHHLAAQFQARSVQKEYVAIARGRFEHASGEINLPIGRDPRMREKMCVRPLESALPGRAATSRYYVEELFLRFTLVRVEPRTGRTHQIRVHLAAIKHPVLADALYGGGEALYQWEISGKKPQPDQKPLISRQALHARKISFDHPVKGERISISAEIPEDMQGVLRALRS